MNRWAFYALLLATLGSNPGCKSSDDALPVITDTSAGSTSTQTDWNPWADGDVRISFLPDGQANHIMNGGIAIDQERDLIYSVAFMTRTLAQIDANTGELLQLIELGDYDHLNPKPAVDGQGIVWFTNDTDAALLRVDPSTATVSQHDVPITAGRAIAPRSGGGVLLAGFTDGGSRLIRIDPSGSVETFTAPPDPILDVIALRDGVHFGVLSLNQDTDTADIVRINASTMEPAEAACSVPTRANTLAETPAGVLVAINSSELVIPSCETGLETAQAAFGFLGTEVVATLDGSVIALDRRGLEDDDGLLVGRGYRYRMPTKDQGLVLESIITTGQNAGYGRLHEGTNTLWINGEDQGEVIGIDLLTEEAVHRVKVATHIEYAVADPDDPAVLYLTGRLSHLAGRVDLRDGVLENATGARSYWPIAPVVVDRDLWYYEQTRTELRSVNMDTLVHNPAIDTDRDDNELHTFGGMAHHPGRDSFFSANSKTFEVFEIDRATGQELNAWSLAGAGIQPTDHGIVEVREHNGLIYATQSLSSVVTVIDPDQPTHILDAQLSDTELSSFSQKTTYQISFIDPAANIYYVSGYALDLDTLERRSDRDLDVDAVVGTLASGHIIGWRPYDDACVVFDPELNEVASIPIEQGDAGKPLFLVDDHWGGRLVTSNMGSATLFVISLQDLIATP